MRAIILAAGAGTRLRPLTEGCPKCLVPIGGRPLLDHQTAALRAAGVDEIVIVVGYEAQQVRDHCGDGARYVDNDAWATTNSIYSLFRARDFLEGEVMLFNCDILFGPPLALRLAAGPDSAIAVDSQAPRLAGEMNVRIDGGGRVIAIGKDLEPSTTQAVSVQLARFDAAGADLVRTDVERLVAADDHEAFPTSAYVSLIAAGGLRVVEAGDLRWAEIDSLTDFERARDEVVPHLV